MLLTMGDRPSDLQVDVRCEASLACPKSSTSTMEAMEPGIPRGRFGRAMAGWAWSSEDGHILHKRVALVMGDQTVIGA